MFLSFTQSRNHNTNSPQHNSFSYTFCHGDEGFDFEETDLQQVLAEEHRVQLRLSPEEDEGHPAPSA